MDRSEFVTNVADGTSPSKSDAASAVAAVFGTIAAVLAHGEPLAIAGFGTFSTRCRAARQGGNPVTGESIVIAATRAPAFKPGQALRDAVNRERA